MNTLLFLTPELPWPPYSGGRIKSSKLVEYLDQKYHLDIGCLLKGNDIDYLPNYVKSSLTNTMIAEAINITRSPKSLLRSIQQRIPLNVYRSSSNSFSRKIDKCIYDYDAVFVDHYEMMQYIPNDYKNPVILHQHNAYYCLWERYARYGNGTASRIAAWIEAKRVKKYEAKVCGRADLVLAAPNDIEKLVEIGVKGSKLTPTMHLGDDRQLDLPSLKWSDTKTSILYVGHLNWEPNVQGLIWFLKNSWPILKIKFPSIQFNIIGANPDPRLLKLSSNDNRVIFQGFQKDLEPWIKSSRVFIAPLLVGSGIKVKVINALTRGIPTVTTPVGVEGLAVKHMNELAVADSAEDMAQYISEILNNKILWDQLSINSRKSAEKMFTWERTFRQMQSSLDKLLPDLSQEAIRNAA